MKAVVPDFAKFKYTLPDAVIEKYKDVVIPQDAAGLITTLRTYSAGGKESWRDIARRVVEGAWSIHNWHVAQEGQGLSDEDREWLAEDMYASMLNLEWCPAGRGLQHMGHDRMWIKGAGVLNNCAFISTKEGLPQALEFLTDMSMLGVGVGFDTEGAYQGFTISTPPVCSNDIAVVVEDSREGWVEAMVHVVRAFTEGSELFNLDFSDVRKKGAPLVTMGGIASGPKPLIDAIVDMVKVFDADITAHYDEADEVIYFEGAPGKSTFKGLSSQIISDVMNLGGRCIVSGGLRRSAELGLFRDGDEFPYVAKLDAEKADSWRWAANNTVNIVGEWTEAQFGKMLDNCCLRGDPGALLTDNICQTGRTGEFCEREDKAIGCNPCAEQNLENCECCNLVEVNVARCAPHRFQYVSQLAFLYGKLVSLLPFHREDINEIVRRNRRIGVGVTGYMEVSPKDYTDMVFDVAYKSLRDWDGEISRSLGVVESIKLTTVKPSGTVSLVLGVSPGMNAHFAEYAIRRINIEKTSPLVPWLLEAGYQLPANIYTDHSYVVEVPMKATGPVNLTAIEQLEHVSRLQRVWSDNMVSNTIVFDDHEKSDMVAHLAANQKTFKSLSFLQRQNQFEQAPIEEITQSRYEELLAGIKPLAVERLWELAGEDAAAVHESDDKFCEGGRCTPSWVEA